MADFVDPEIEALKARHLRERAEPADAWRGFYAPGGAENPDGLTRTASASPVLEGPQNLIQSHRSGDPVPAPRGDAPKTENANPGVDSKRSGDMASQVQDYRRSGVVPMPESLRAGAYQDAPHEYEYAPSGYQQQHDRAVEDDRNRYYEEAQNRIAEQGRRNDPQRRNLEAEQLNAAYESLMPAQRPAGEAPFTQGPDGTFRNTPTPPRIDQSENAQKLDLAQGMAGIESSKDKFAFVAIDRMIDQGTKLELDQLRTNPSYVAATPEQKANAEAIIAGRNATAKTQARALKLGARPSATGAMGELLGGGLP